MFTKQVMSICFRNGSAISLSAPPITTLITPEPVRHCRIPELPLDGSLLFEFLFFIYLLVALFIQYINIYKTVWWYPYNHPASCTSLVSSPASASTWAFFITRLLFMLLQSRNHQAFDIKGVNESSHATPSVRATSSPVFQGRKYMADERSWGNFLHTFAWSS